jgi:hypothetical protein
MIQECETEQDSGENEPGTVRNETGVVWWFLPVFRRVRVSAGGMVMWHFGVACHSVPFTGHYQGLGWAGTSKGRIKKARKRRALVYICAW